MFDRLLGDIGEHRVGTAERHHGHLAEENGDLAEDVRGSQGDEQQDDRNEPEREPDARCPQRPRDGRAHVLRQFVAEETVHHGAVVLAATTVIIVDLKHGGARPSAEKTDQCRAEDDDRKWNIEEENSHECGRGERDHRIVLERPLADPKYGLQYDREYRGLEPEKQRDDDRHIAPGRVDVAQRHDGDDAGNDKKPAGDDAAERAMHQPADIGRKLLRLGARQQHAIVERMQEPPLRHPALLLDQDAMHDRDLTGGAAEAEPRDLQPGQERLAQRDAVIELRPRLSDGELSQLCASLAGLNFRVVAHSTRGPIAASSGSTRKGR